MTHPFRTRRLVLFAAGAAVAAGAVVVPTTAFAATPAAPRTVVADTGDADDGNKSDLLLVVPPGSEGTIKVAPGEDQPAKNHPGKWGNKRPGKGGSSGTKVVVTDGKPVLECFAAPCGPAEDVVIGGIAPIGEVDGTKVIRGSTPLD